MVGAGMYRATYDPGMDAREAYHRRAYRVALLLTDSRAHALRILEHVAAAVPAPERSSDARFDRAVVQASRPIHEHAEHAASDDGLASLFDLSDDAKRLWDGAHRLDPQPLEAWVLFELERLDAVRTARAMDCSKNAMERIHLPNARTVLSQQTDAYDDALDELRRALDTLDPSDALAHIEGVVATQRRRSRLVTLVSVVLLLVFFGALTFVLFDLLAWQGHETNVTSGAAERFSNPMPSEDE